MVRPIDRISPEHAERVLVELVADATTRAAIIDAMARIVEAAAVHPASWSITLQPDRIQLNVGVILVFRVDRTQVRIAGPADAAFTGLGVENLGDFSAMPGVAAYTARHDAPQFLTTLPALLNACLITTNAAKHARGPWRRAHSPGVVALLERSIGHTFPWQPPDDKQLPDPPEPESTPAEPTVSVTHKPKAAKTFIRLIDEELAPSLVPRPGSVGWLHLTDLHQGMGDSSWLWPNVLTQVFDDLDRLHKLCGPWDLVLFTGDLTQRGSDKEFTELTRSLDRLWKHLARLGSTPRLIAVPGNHDLERPKHSYEPIPLALSQWHRHKPLRDHVFRDSDSPYLVELRRYFAAYTRWTESFAPFVRDDGVKQGLLPGDLSASLTINGLDIGVVGLNSTFLQLTGENFEGHLDVDPRQLQAVCGEYPPEWIDRHHINLLMTHHPPEWLDRRARDDFGHEIDIPGRFAAHFFGHMHEGTAVSTSHGGAQARHAIQGASLFGLAEYDGPESRKTSRIHGYSAGRFEPASADRMRVRIFPRRMVVGGGGRRVAPDHTYALDGDSFAYEVPTGKRS